MLANLGSTVGRTIIREYYLIGKVYFLAQYGVKSSPYAMLLVVGAYDY